MLPVLGQRDGPVGDEKLLLHDRHVTVVHGAGVEHGDFADKRVLAVHCPMDARRGVGHVGVVVIPHVVTHLFVRARFRFLETKK